jgi:hypothetical protein
VFRQITELLLERKRLPGDEVASIIETAAERKPK